LYGVGSRFVQDVSQPQTLTASPESKPNKGTGPEVDAVFLTDSVLTPLSSQSAAVMGFSLLLISVAGLAVFQLNGHKRAAIGFTLAWLVCPIALIYLFLLQRGTFFAVRYVLYTLPAFLLLVGYGLDQLITLIDRKLTPGFTSHRLMTAGCSLILVMPLVIGEVDELIDHYRRPAYEDWRAVSQLLHANAAPNDAVLAILAEPTMNWYYPAATVAHGTYGRNEAIWAAIADHPRRWFVLSSYSVKRDEGLRQWLSDQGAVVIAIDERVIVYLQHEGMSQTELLHEVETFDLPAKAATYALLADQFSAVGQVETAQRFYQQAIDLAASDDQRAEYATRLAQLP
jgi:hypothetical protein